MYVYVCLSPHLEFLFEPLGMVLHIVLELNVARLLPVPFLFPLNKRFADFKIHQIFRAFKVLYWMLHISGQEAPIRRDKPGAWWLWWAYFLGALQSLGSGLELTWCANKQKASSSSRISRFRKTAKTCEMKSVGFLSFTVITILFYIHVLKVLSLNTSKPVCEGGSIISFGWNLTFVL